MLSSTCGVIVGAVGAEQSTVQSPCSVLHVARGRQRSFWSLSRWRKLCELKHITTVVEGVYLPTSRAYTTRAPRPDRTDLRRGSRDGGSKAGNSIPPAFFLPCGSPSRKHSLRSGARAESRRAPEAWAALPYGMRHCGMHGVSVTTVFSRSGRWARQPATPLAQLSCILLENS